MVLFDLLLTIILLVDLLLTIMYFICYLTAICRRYLGGDSGNMVAFEYIDEKSQPTMVSVGANKKLLPRVCCQCYSAYFACAF